MGESCEARSRTHESKALTRKQQRKRERSESRRDTPNWKCERLVNIPKATYKDRRVLTDHPLHVGEAIAAVAAETEALAEQALSLIRVEYEKLPFLLDAFKAMEPGQPLLHETVMLGDEEKKVENNIAVPKLITQGDIEKGFKEADIIVEEEFRTGRVYHAQMETKSVVCQPEADGGITVWTTTQTIHNVRQLLGELFQIPLRK
jgi:xanthine dehydrogenase molybdenum-binding subunit